jgi:hypothetical protein
MLSKTFTTIDQPSTGAPTELGPPTKKLTRVLARAMFAGPSRAKTFPMKKRPLNLAPADTATDATAPQSDALK